MFDKKYRRFIQSFLLVLPMTGLVCAINTFVARGAATVFTIATLKKWGISLLIAFPAVLLVQPLAIKLTNRLIKSD